MYKNQFNECKHFSKFSTDGDILMSSGNDFHCQALRYITLESVLGVASSSVSGSDIVVELEGSSVSLK